MSSGKLNIGLIDLYLSSCHNIKCGRLMDASNAVQYQAMALSVTIVSQSKVLEVPSLCLVFVNKCPCEIIWTVASIPIICITFSENLTQFSMIVNPTIKSLLFSECRSHKNTYKTPYDKYRSRPEKYILNRRVLYSIFNHVVPSILLLHIFIGS